MFYKPTYLFSTNFTPTINSNTIELFNNTGSNKIIKICTISIASKISSTITGRFANFQVYSTSAVGTGGTSLTVIKADSNDSNLPSQITARMQSTVTLVGFPICGGGLDIDDARYTEKVYLYYNYGNNENRQITIRENAGLAVRQGNLLAVGDGIITVEFTLE